MANNELDNTTRDAREAAARLQSWLDADDATHFGQHEKDIETVLAALNPSSEGDVTPAALVTRPEWHGGDCPTCRAKHPFDNVFCSDGYHLGEGESRG